MNKGSNIPKARETIKIALMHDLDPGTRSTLEVALGYMTRAKAVRKARAKAVKIDANKRDLIKSLAKDPNRTMQEIATLTGVRSSGRVSEVLNGLR